jgi:DNA helicase IV
MDTDVDLARRAGDDLEVEQAHLDRAYRALAAMRDRTERAVGIAVSDARGGEMDAYATEAHLRRRLRELEVDVPGLAFGRIVEEGAAGEGDGDFRIGRRHVEEPDGATLVMDWRAPAAVPFYRATPADPLGLARRRRFATAGTRIEALFDEDFDDPDSVHAAHGHGGVPDPLLAELERARTGTMRDIVATIQGEQDVVIRAPLESCLVVQGGPGTGKTAVGLHRAAFLLYEHRRLLDEIGVLVVGPNPTFLRYISQVLPSLGETSVRQATVAGLVGTPTDAPVDTAARAQLLGDARMAAVVQAAVRGAVRAPEGDLDLPTAWGLLRIPEEAVAAAVAEVAAREVPHSVARTALRTILLRLARLELEEKPGIGLVTSEALEDDLRPRRHLAKALDRMWPPLSGPAVAKRLLTNKQALLVAADGLLDGDEVALLVRRGARRLDDEPWSAGELVLVDEARAATEGSPRSYGHVVVDEAQDLSAMAFRAVARRCPSGSLTILGDLAQATAPGAQRSWSDVIGHLAPASESSVAELTLGYRVPGPVLDWANRLLAVAAPGVVPARSVRLTGRAPVVEAVPEPSVLAHAAAGAAGALVAAGHSSVGVIAATVEHEAVRAAGLDSAVQLVGPAEAKGLEFDGVVVVEPVAVAAAAGPDEAAGLRLLYVALTRAVQELVVVHHAPLPAALVEP